MKNLILKEHTHVAFVLAIFPLVLGAVGVEAPADTVALSFAVLSDVFPSI